MLFQLMSLTYLICLCQEMREMPGSSVQGPQTLWSPLIWADSQRSYHWGGNLSSPGLGVSSFSATGGHASIISAASSSTASNATDNTKGSRHTSGTGMEDDDQLGLGHGICQWQVNAIVDLLSDDEDVGNVDMVLNRLERTKLYLNASPPWSLQRMACL